MKRPWRRPPRSVSPAAHSGYGRPSSRRERSEAQPAAVCDSPTAWSCAAPLGLPLLASPTALVPLVLLVPASPLPPLLGGVPLMGGANAVFGASGSWLGVGVSVSVR